MKPGAGTLVVRLFVSISFMILETAVGRARWCVWARGWREARRPHAGACNDERQRQARDRAYQRVRSGLTLPVNPVEDEEASIHVEFHELMSGQLRFLG